jgi:hypothetical protein
VPRNSIAGQDREGYFAGRYDDCEAPQSIARFEDQIREEYRATPQANDGAGEVERAREVPEALYQAMVAALPNLTVPEAHTACEVALAATQHPESDAGERPSDAAIEGEMLRVCRSALLEVRDWQLRDERNNPNVPEDFKGSPFDYLRKIANDALKTSARLAWGIDQPATPKPASDNIGGAGVGMEVAREAFFNLIADASEWVEQPDEGGIYYSLKFEGASFVPFINALGIEQKDGTMWIDGEPFPTTESPAEAVERCINECTPSPQGKPSLSGDGE